MNILMVLTSLDKPGETLERTGFHVQPDNPAA